MTTRTHRHIRRSRGSALAALLAALPLLVPGGAGAAWNQVVGGPSPINLASDRDARAPSMVQIGGVPYVAWREHDGTNFELRVARLNAAGTAWEQLAGGDSPINQSSTENAGLLSLAEVGGVPHVAWAESDGTNSEVRVARLNAAGTGWEKVGQAMNPASPINHSSTRSANPPSLIGIGGVPYVAWAEPDGTNNEVRVSRLNAAGTGWEQLVGGPSPINQADNRSVGSGPILIGIGGVPYVAWAEEDGINSELRVARLNAAGTAWEKVGQATNPASPINHASDKGAGEVRLTAIDGVPYVAWLESDGTNREVRVSRLNAAGTAFEQVVGGASPINHASDKDVDEPSITGIGGIPYIAWREQDGTNDELRVSRLNAAGTAFEQVVGGASPINHASDQDAGDTSLTGIGVVPYVAWHEDDSATTAEIRVSRLEPEFLATSETATDTTAMLSAEVRTYGVNYPIGFEHGPGAGFGNLAEPVMAQSGNADSAVATQTIAGLTPFTDYSWRPFGTDLARATAIGPTRSFRTPDTGLPLIVAAGVKPKTFAIDPKGPTEVQVTKGRAKRGTTFSFTLSEAAAVTFTIERKTRGRKVGKKCRKETRRNKKRKRCTRYVAAGKFAHQGTAGKNKKKFSGRIGKKRLRPASYRATLIATDPAGNRSKPRRLNFRVVRR